MVLGRLGMTMIAMGISVLAATGVAWAAAPSNSVVLVWTSPGDDGVDGTATLYDVRYSINLPITEANFYLCPTVSTPPRPQQGGSLQTVTVKDLLPGAVYFFAMKTVDERGNWSTISNVAMHVSTGTVSAGDAPVPLAFSAPAPNPARTSTRFELSLPQAAPVRVEAFDLSGRRVRSLLDGFHAAGRADVIWDLRNDHGLPVEAGVYLIRAVLPGKTVTHRSIVVR